MKPTAILLALSLAVPAAAAAAPAPTTHTVDASVQLRTTDGKIVQDLQLSTIEHQCVTARIGDATRMFDVELCHQDDTAAGKVLHVKWSLSEGKRMQQHEAYAVVAAGGTFEVGSTRGKGDALVVSVK